MNKYTDKENTMLWEKLKPDDDPYKHDQSDDLFVNVTCCAKCGKTINDEPCPFPSPFPGSDADIAEAIRVWMLEQELGTQLHWFLELMTMTDRVVRGMPLELIATPADKIQAALSVWGMENE